MLSDALRATARLFLCGLLWAVVGIGTPHADAEAVDGARPQSRILTLASGLSLNYVVQGDPRGQTIVLLHGVGDSWHSYELVLPLLPPTYHVYAITLRGHGWSDHPQAGFTRQDFAADVSAFLRQLDLKHVVLVGHSLGSFVAEQVAADDPQRVSKLVLIGAGPGAIPDAKLRAEIAASFAQVQDPLDFRFARDFQAGTIYAPVPPAFFETLVAEALKAPASTWHGIAEAWQQPPDYEFLGRIAAPTLVLWGEHDSIFSRADQQQLLQRIPHARLVVYAGTGHALHWERPRRVAADLLRFAAGDID
jgi:pimeloyl-ACP methyl ester carboxylesterase